MNLFQQAKKSNWMQPYRRRTSIHKFDLYVRNMGSEIQRFFNVDFNNLIALGSGFDLQWYFDRDQFKGLARAVSNRVITDVRSKSNHINNIITHAEAGVRSLKNWDQFDFSSLSDRQLIAKFKVFSKAIDKINPILYAPLVIELDLFEYTKSVLTKYYSGEKLNKSFEIAINPMSMTPITRAEYELCQLRIKCQDFIKAGKKHFNKYKWIGMRFVEDSPRSGSFYAQKLSKMSLVYCRNFIARQQKARIIAEREFNEILGNLQLSDRRLIKLVNQLSTLRHERDVYRNQIYYSGHFLYREISRRFKVSVRDLLSYSIVNLIDLIVGHKKVSRGLVTKRKRKYAFIVYAGKVELIVNKNRITSIQNLLSNNNRISKDAILQGTSTFVGKAQGVVQIIRLSYVTRDLHSVQPGDILVAESTKPEYLPAMKQAAAVITNEGGLTCHAAIVSREFKIPTVVGTKIATKVLKNGDRVEVNAISGIIKKI